MNDENHLIREGRAYSPGHITGLFQICDSSNNFLEKGSRGAGICISMGTTSYVCINKMKLCNTDDFNHQIQITIDRVLTSTAKTTLRTVELILEKCKKMGIIEHNLEITIEIENELPLGQGFGLSGAGALSTALALNDALDTPLSRQDLLEASHIAEVEQGTGLGDVGAQGVGGVSVRTKPGIPPYGEISILEGDFNDINIGDLEIIICIIGSELFTKEILNDLTKRELIRNYGGIYLDKLLESPNIKNLFLNSYNFARDTKLVSMEVNEVIKLLGKHNCLASMSMLGNSIFALAQNDQQEIKTILEQYGPTHISKIDGMGARVLTKK